MTDAPTWTLLLIQLPTEPSRHRVAVWRELRRTGAVPIGSGTWLLPGSEPFRAALPRVVELVERGAGSLAEIDAQPRDERAAGVLRDAYARARIDEWRELVDDCAKFEAEIDREVAKGKFTLGELEEEEQSLERLQRWFATVQARDVLDLEEGRSAAERLAACERRLAEYAEQVYAVVEQANAAVSLGDLRG